MSLEWKNFFSYRIKWEEEYLRPRHPQKAVFSEDNLILSFGMNMHGDSWECMLTDVFYCTLESYSLSVLLEKNRKLTVGILLSCFPQLNLHTYIVHSVNYFLSYTFDHLIFSEIHSRCLTCFIKNYCAFNL